MKRLTESAVVKILTRRIKKHGFEGSGLRRNPTLKARITGRTFVGVVAVQMLAAGHDYWRGAAPGLSKRMARRVMKKVRQPFRKNMQRKRMKRRAAGKNEVRRMR